MPPISAISLLRKYKEMYFIEMFYKMNPLQPTNNLSQGGRVQYSSTLSYIPFNVF